jgi:hypothetical protein
MQSYGINFLMFISGQRASLSERRSIAFTPWHRRILNQPCVILIKKDSGAVVITDPEPLHTWLEKQFIENSSSPGVVDKPSQFTFELLAGIA